MSRVCAAGLALLAFSCALIIGLCVGNPFVSVVFRALQIMLVFYVLGLILGIIGEKAVKENFDAEADMVRKQMQPAEATAIEADNVDLTEPVESEEFVQTTPVAPAQPVAAGST